MVASVFFMINLSAIQCMPDDFHSVGVGDELFKALYGSLFKNILSDCLGTIVFNI